MAFTDKQIQAVRQILKLIKTHDLELALSNAEIDSINERVADAIDMSQWNFGDWKRLLKPVIEAVVREMGNSLPIRQHDHLSEENGGPCFSEKGGLLI